MLKSVLVIQNKALKGYDIIRFCDDSMIQGSKYKEVNLG